MGCIDLAYFTPYGDAIIGEILPDLSAGILVKPDNLKYGGQAAKDDRVKGELAFDAPVIDWTIEVKVLKIGPNVSDEINVGDVLLVSPQHLFETGYCHKLRPGEQIIIRDTPEFVICGLNQ